MTSLSLFLLMTVMVDPLSAEDKPVGELFEEVDFSTGKLTDALAPPKTDGESEDSQPTKTAESSPEIDIPSGKWTVRFISQNASPKPSLLPKNSGLDILLDLQMVGAKQDNPHLLGHFNSEAAWYVQQGYLLPVDKKDSALRIATVKDFELQGIWNVEGRGGWFILLGYDDGHGYVLENTRFISKESGGPWHLSELRGGRGLPETFDKVCHEHKYEWKGDQPIRLTVQDKQLSLKVGEKDLLKEVPLANYGPGELIVGTFKGKYDPKPLKIKSLRIRSLP
ncbi:hypothetical protein [Polystyrenella longa]|uniref:hypothetical protein n=1 Tax=Polystyrenella longa TaxID=2528007 RepID=UPI0011A5B54F|nr:hypothetical protein [Polystyrenella longa]